MAVMDERLAALGLQRLSGLRHQAVLRRPVELVGDERDAPTAVLLAHGEQPLEGFLDARVVRVASLHQQSQDGAGIVGGVLVRQDAAQVAFLRLAGEDVLAGGCRPGVLAGAAVNLHQGTQVAPGLDQAMVDGRVLLSARARPGAVGKLLAEKLTNAGQLPELLYRAGVLTEQVAAGEVDQRLVAAGEQGRQRVEPQGNAPGVQGINSSRVERELVFLDYHRLPQIYRHLFRRIKLRFVTFYTILLAGIIRCNYGGVMSGAGWI